MATTLVTSLRGRMVANALLHQFSSYKQRCSANLIASRKQSSLASQQSMTIPNYEGQNGKAPSTFLGGRAENKRIVSFIDPKGVRYTCEASDGETILDIAKAHELELEGACQGDCACSTCHVIVVSGSRYEAMEQPTEREEDMLDLAHGLTSTSRLGCQIKVSAALDGAEFKLPGIVQSRADSSL